MPVFKRVPKRDHNARAQAGTDLVQRGIHEIYAAVDDAENRRASHLGVIAHHTARAASLSEDIHAHAKLADSLMDQIETLNP